MVCICCTKVPTKAHINHSFMQRPVIWTGRKMGKKLEEQKKTSKTIDIVSYALEVSVNCVICVFVVHFRSSDTFKSFKS